MTTASFEARPAAVAEHERRAAVILDGMYQFVALLNARGDILEVNRAALEGAGHQIEEIRGNPFWTARWWQVSESIRTGLRAAVERAAAGEFIRYEVEVYGEQSGLVPITIDFSLRPIQGASGSVDYLLAEGRNITERKRAEQEVARHRRHTEQATALLGAIVASSDDAIISKDLRGVITSWNKSAERMFGYSADEAVGKSITLLIPPDRLDEERTILEKLARGERVDHFETIRVRKDGARLDISLTISPVRDSDGRIIGASKVARDISERKHAEAELRQQRAIVERLYGVGLVLSAELDLEKLLQAVTDAATNLSGAKFGAFFYNSVEGAGDHYHLYTVSGAPAQAFEKFGSPRITALLAPTFAGAGIVRLDDVTQDPRYGKNAPHHGIPLGHLPVTSYLAIPIIGRKGRVFGGLFLAHPEPGVFSAAAERAVSGLAAQAAVAVENAHLYETEQRLRKEAENAGRAKDEFLAMLGHELRNPLSSIRNAAEAASLDPAAGERAFGIVRRGAHQLARLVDDLLDVARITQGKIALRTERVSLASVLERAVETTRPLVEEQGHQLTLSLPGASVDVHGDPTRLEQVTANLITNAAKFTKPGGRIHVAVERQGAEAILRVRDEGVGITADLLPRIFDLFKQGDDGLARTGGGLGIGLTVARRLVELHGGRIEASSEGPGMGAEFVVRLTALPVEDVAASEPRPPAPAAQRRARILIVEDNDDAADSLAMLFEQLGHQVETVREGTLAMERAYTYRPDVMFVDIGLPGIDGYEVARRIRRESGLANLVLVALTGYGSQGDKQRALAAGFDRHFTKPIDPLALRALVETFPTSPKPTA